MKTLFVRVLKVLFKFAAFLFCFLFAAVFFLLLTHLANNGMNVKSFKAVELFFQKLAVNPLFLWDSYVYWWKAFVKNWNEQRHSFVLFIPFATPVLLFFYLIWLYIRSVYSFGLWYFLNNRFARMKDIEKMGVLKGYFMNFGRVHGKMLSLSKPSAVLCFGNEGSGKSSCIAIPSILQSDSCSVIALDNSGMIAKCTSGYRSRLGPVFYFDWNKADSPENKEFYARWNPLSRDNLPEKLKERNVYLQKIVRHLLENIKEKSENYWDLLVGNVLYVLLLFYVSKIMQAEANDYFLEAIVEKGRLKSEDKDMLRGYYAAMPQKYASAAEKKLNIDVLNTESYMPIGSWGGIPTEWQGKDANLIMFADWVRFLFDNLEQNAYSQEELWKMIIENLKNEADFFGYNYAASQGLQRIINMSRSQMAVVFPMLFNCLNFLNDTVLREKLSSSDFSHKIIRGMKRPDKRTKPVSIYCVSEGKNGKFLSAMFIDLMIEECCRSFHADDLPVLAVLDDLGQNYKLSSLLNGIIYGRRQNFSVLMLGNKLKYLEAIYGKECLENIVSNANYKILLADDDKTLSQKLENLACYGTKSVQIPAVKVGAFLKVKQGLADANYYRKIAKNVLSKREIMTRGYQLILVEGFYHLPILAHSVLFVNDELLKKKAAIKPEYILPEDFLKRRNLQDADLPEEPFVSVRPPVGTETKHKERLVKSPVGGADWWMYEDAFSVTADSKPLNPFEKKS